MNTKLSTFSLLCVLLLGSGVHLLAHQIYFPSRVENGSFEEWASRDNGSFLPVGWHTHGFVDVSQAQPFIGDHSVELWTGPGGGNLYQDFSYQRGALLFGCAFIEIDWGGRLTVSYRDEFGDPLFWQSWGPTNPDWDVVLEVLHPPAGTHSIKIELVPVGDSLGGIIVDHIFMIPIYQDENH
jgi:hypothetical protein